MNNLFYLFIGYTGLWIIIFSLLIYMNTKINEIEDEIKSITNKK